MDKPDTGNKGRTEHRMMTEPPLKDPKTHTHTTQLKR